MDYKNMRVVDLKALSKEGGLRGYSRLKKAELIAFLREPSTRHPPRPIPAPRPPPRPIPAPRPPPRPIPAPCTRPPLVRPRQPELRLYQPKPKRGK